MRAKVNNRIESAQITREKLINAARKLFATKGFYDSGTHEIVNEANVTRGALYHHFSQKEDLFLAVFNQIQEEMYNKSSMRQNEDNKLNAWINLKESIANFLKASSTSEVQRIILIDGPAVLGWSKWRELEAHYGLGIIENAVQIGIGLGYIRKQEIKPLSNIILSMIDEAALMIANSKDPKKVTEEALKAIDTLLSNLG